VEEETVATPVVKISAAEKVAIAEAKKLAKEQEKAEKKMEKEREKEAKKLEKKAKVPSAAIAKPKKIVEAKQVVLAAPVAAVATVAPVAPVAPVKTEKKRVQKVEKVVEIPADGMVHPWQYKGKHYVRNSDNEVWLRGTDGGCGEWQGIYMPGEDRIDDSVAEPEFEDE
jgi:hypothetical protein